MGCKQSTVDDEVIRASQDNEIQAIQKGSNNTTPKKQEVKNFRSVRTLDPETPDISRLSRLMSNQDEELKSEYQSNQKLYEVDMLDDESTKHEKKSKLSRAGPSLDRAVPLKHQFSELEERSDEDEVDTVPNPLSKGNKSNKSKSLNHKLKNSRKLVKSNTYADEWTVLVGTTDEEIAEEIAELNSMLVEPLGRRPTLRAKTAENIQLFMDMIQDEPLSSVFDPEDDVCDEFIKGPVQIERAVKFGRIGCIEYVEYAKKEASDVKQLNRDEVHDLNYDLMADGIPAYFFRNIYVEKNLQEMGILYPNRLYQFTKKDSADQHEFTATSTTKFDAKFETVAMPVTGEFSRHTKLTWSKWQRETNLNGGKIDVHGLKISDSQKHGGLREEAGFEWKQRKDWCFETKRNY